MSNILVSGGAGFIGAHVARALSDRGDSVIIVDDFNNRYDPRIKRARIYSLFPSQKAPNIVRGDIRNRKLIKKLFRSHHINSVIHLAAWASVQPSIEDPFTYTSVNVDGTVVLLEEARKHAINHFIFASSSSVYGGIKTNPFREDMDVSHPISPYAATKVAGEALCATWHSLYGIPMTCLRFFTVYGPWGRPEMALFTFAHAIRTGKPVPIRGHSTKRDFTYIDDIVQGILLALDKPHGYSTYNLGKGDPVSLARLIRILEKTICTKARKTFVPLPPGDIPQTFADISRATKELGYNPKVSIEEGVPRFIEWYLDTYAPCFEKKYARKPQ